MSKMRKLSMTRRHDLERRVGRLLVKVLTGTRPIDAVRIDKFGRIETWNATHRHCDIILIRSALKRMGVGK